MSTQYLYELWNGKECVGYHSSMFLLLGKFIVVPETPILKQLYNKKLKTVTAPLIYRVVDDNGVDIISRRVIDVRRKSKRQIAVLVGRSAEQK